MWQTVTSQNIGNILWLSKHQVETTVSRCYFLYALGYENPTTWRLQHFGRCIHLIQQLFFARVLLDSWNLAPQILSKFYPKNLHQLPSDHGHPWIIAMQPSEIWLLARWATRIDELARSLRAAFSLGAESSRVTWELESRWVLFSVWKGWIHIINQSTNGYWSTQRCYFFFERFVYLGSAPTPNPATQWEKMKGFRLGFFMDSLLKLSGS